MSLNICFDISQTGSMKAGCGFYADSLISGLIKLNINKFQYKLLTHFGNFFFDSKLGINLKKYNNINVSYNENIFIKDSSFKYWTDLNIENKLNNPNIIHSNNYWCPQQLKKTKLVYTLYDTSIMENPDWSTEENRLGCFKGLFYSSIYADHIIAISDFSKKSYLKTFPHFPEQNISVIYPFSRFEDYEYIDIKPSIFKNLLSNKFLLCVGTLEPRKNLDFLINIYANYLKYSNEKFPLVIAGGSGWKMDNFNSNIRNLGIGDKVILTGYIKDEEMAWLYKNCCINLYPSLFEGFGLPVLEGMKFGAPTIASKSSSIVEILQNKDCLLDPYDSEVWLESIIKICNNNNLRNALSNDALKNSKKFIPIESISKLNNIYSSLSSQEKRLIHE